jgi:hypothetical protein
MVARLQARCESFNFRPTKKLCGLFEGSCMPDSRALKVIAATQRGRPFADGNPGRKPGSKNRTTVVAAALLDGEAETLVRKAVELAKDGNVAMLKLLLGRILPRERLIEFDLPPMNFADDAVASLGCILAAVAQGRISASEGACLSELIDTYTRAIEMADVVKRLDMLEAQINGGGVR